MTRWLVVLLLVAGCGGLGPSVADQPNTLTTMGFGLPGEHATARVKVFRDHRFGQGGEAQWELVMAASVVATVPMILLLLLAQRYFVRGVVTQRVEE